MSHLFDPVVLLQPLGADRFVTCVFELTVDCGLFHNVCGF